MEVSYALSPIGPAGPVRRPQSRPSQSQLRVTSGPPSPLSGHLSHCALTTVRSGKVGYSQPTPSPSLSKRRAYPGSPR